MHELSGHTLEYDRRDGDRRQSRSYVFRDRRTGFDRRNGTTRAQAGVLQWTLLGLRSRPAILLTLLGVVNVLNVADFSLTLNALGAGAGEANPIMRSLFGLGPAWAGLFKVAAIALASWIVWRHRRYRLVLAVALLMAVMFFGVLVYHVLGLTVLG